MAGYIRQDTANNISNTSVIDADDLDAEFDALESAFNATSGHVHDGSSGTGAPIIKVGPGQDVIVSTSQVLPKTTATLDLGSATAKFKNAYLSGAMASATSSTSGNATVGGTLGVSGATTLTGAATLSSTLAVTGATTLTGAATLNGGLNIGADTLAEYISDTVGAMVTGNTETGITVTYDDATNTLDFVLSADPTITLTGAVTGSGSMTNLGDVSIATTNTADPVITLAGDATGSVTLTNLASGTLTVAIVDDSHNHIIANVDGLQTALDAKADDTTTVSAGSGLTGGGAIGSNITISHADTSSQATVNNSGLTFIQDVTLDTYGHVTSLTSTAVVIPDSLGVNQMYANTTLTTGTWYQNTTGRAIAIYYKLNTGGGYAVVSSTASGGIRVGGEDGDSGTWDNGYFIVPNSKYYQTVGSSNNQATKLS